MNDWEDEMAIEVVLEPQKPPKLYSYTDVAESDEIGSMSLAELELEVFFSGYSD